MQSIDQKWACPCNKYVAIAKHYLMNNNIATYIILKHCKAYTVVAS